MKVYICSCDEIGYDSPEIVKVFTNEIDAIDYCHEKNKDGKLVGGMSSYSDHLEKYYDYEEWDVTE